MPNTEWSAVGLFIIGFSAFITLVGGILATALTVKKLFFEKESVDDRYVTRKELREDVDRLEGKLKENVAEIEKTVDSLKEDMAVRMDRIEGYTRTGIHDLRNIMNSLMLKIERLVALREIDGRGVRQIELIEPTLSPPEPPV